MLPVLKAHFDELNARFSARASELEQSRRAMVERHRSERAAMVKAQQARQDREHEQRRARFRRGMRGLWDRVTGRHTQIRRENEMEAHNARQHDAGERQTLREVQLDARRALQRRIFELREERLVHVNDVGEDVSHYRAMRGDQRHTQTEKIVQDDTVDLEY